METHNEDSDTDILIYTHYKGTTKKLGNDTQVEDVEATNIAAAPFKVKKSERAHCFVLGVSFI